jgi:hypothetical protein
MKPNQVADSYDRIAAVWTAPEFDQSHGIAHVYFVAQRVR